MNPISPAYCRPAAFAAFAAQLPHLGSTQGLFRAAFAIARHERPTVELGPSEAIIANLTETVRHRVHTPNIEAKLAHLHDVLFDVVGFRGNVDDYYDPANSYLPDVLQSRRGLPITLTLVYKCVAEGIGLTVHGVNAPGHFLAAVATSEGKGEPPDDEQWMYVDPFYGGQLLNEQDVLDRIAETTGRDAPRSIRLITHATGRQWLNRMLINLQAVFARIGRERDLLAMQELQALLEDNV